MISRQLKKLTKRIHEITTLLFSTNLNPVDDDEDKLEIGSYRAMHKEAQNPTQT